jgi:hypothetical protein
MEVINPAMMNPAMEKVSERTNIESATGNGLSPRKKLRDQLKADWSRMTTDPDSLGLSEAQKADMLAQQTQAARTGAQGQVAQLSRDALAGQGFQAGAFAQAQQDVADQVQDATVKAQPDVNRLHHELVNKERDRIMGDMQRKKQENAAEAQFWAQFGLDSAATIGNLMNGTPAAGGNQQVGTTQPATGGPAADPSANVA